MSLSDRDSRLQVCRKSHVADLDRLDSDAAQNELAVDRFADANIDDLAVAGESCDRIPRRPKSPDVLVRELRRRRWLRHGWRLRNNRLRRWLWHGFGSGRRRRRRRRFLVREEVALAPIA